MKTPICASGEILTKKTKWLFALLVMLGCNSEALAQASNSNLHPTVSQVEDHLAGLVERMFVPAADAMPEP